MHFMKNLICTLGSDIFKNSFQNHKSEVNCLFSNIIPVLTEMDIEIDIDSQLVALDI